MACKFFRAHPTKRGAKETAHELRQQGLRTRITRRFDRHMPGRVFVVWTCR
jgi:hypothetical protein